MVSLKNKAKRVSVPRGGSAQQVGIIGLCCIRATGHSDVIGATARIVSQKS
jgi:hypothetical protein